METSRSAVKPAPWVFPSPPPARFETDRLVLRAWEHGDAEALFRAVESCRDSLLPWLPWAATDNLSVPGTHYSIERFKREMSSARPGAYVLGVFDKGTGEVVGGTGLHDIKPDTHQAETGYWVRGDLRGRGLCTEFAGGMITWALTPRERGGWGLRRMEIRCAAGNLASQRVPRKLGMRQEARLVKDRWVDGRGWDDTLVCGVLGEEWDAGARRVRGGSGSASAADKGFDVISW